MAGTSPAMMPLTERSPWRSSNAAEHVAKTMIDRMQVLRRRIDRAQLDHKTVANDAITERAFGRVRSIPGEMYRLAVASAHAGLLRLRERWADWSRARFTSDSASHVSIWEKPDQTR